MLGQEGVMSCQGGQHFLKEKRSSTSEKNRDWEKMIDKKLTGPGTGVLGDL